MAERRMFSKKVINSDTFLDMPASARAFYYHLAMMADDDGFVNNTRSAMRSAGSANEDIQTLADKGFIIYFEKEGVSVIRHWKVSNSLRRDVFTETDYKEIKAGLSCGNDGVYSLRSCSEPAESGYSITERSGK
jgi:hypothetical protein